MGLGDSEKTDRTVAAKLLGALERGERFFPRTLLDRYEAQAKRPLEVSVIARSRGKRRCERCEACGRHEADVPSLDPVRGHGRFRSRSSIGLLMPDFQVSKKGRFAVTPPPWRERSRHRATSTAPEPSLLRLERRARRGLA